MLARVHPSLVSSEIVESWLLGGNWQDQIVEKIVSGAGGGECVHVFLLQTLSREVQWKIAENES